MFQIVCGDVVISDKVPFSNAKGFRFKSGQIQ